MGLINTVMIIGASGEVEGEGGVRDGVRDGEGRGGGSGSCVLAVSAEK